MWGTAALASVAATAKSATAVQQVFANRDNWRSPLGSPPWRFRARPCAPDPTPFSVGRHVPSREATSAATANIAEALEMPGPDSQNAYFWPRLTRLFSSAAVHSLALYRS